jgi:hypothetical protein
MVTGGENPHLNFSLGFFSQNRVYIFRVLHLRFEGEVRKKRFVYIEENEAHQASGSSGDGRGSKEFITAGPVRLLNDRSPLDAQSETSACVSDLLQ